MKDEAYKHHNPTKVRLIDEDEAFADYVVAVEDTPKGVLFRQFVREGLARKREQYARSVASRKGNGSAQEGLNYAELRLAE
jgi:hypothetical protein